LSRSRNWAFMLVLASPGRNTYPLIERTGKCSRLGAELAPGSIVFSRSLLLYFILFPDSALRHGTFRLEMENLGESVPEVVSVPIHSFARVVMMGADDSIAFILPSTVSNLTYR